MAVDPEGRLTISPQKDDQPLLRVTLTSKGQVEKIEPLTSVVKQAMGLCYAHGSLYANAHGPNGTGLYRLTDANHNGKFEADEVKFLKKFEGEGEHGYHAVVEGPDGMMYVMNGNHTKVPQGIEKDSPHQHYEEDLVLPRQWDAGGHAVGILAPGGYVVRTDPDGKKWELMLAGFRNSYDFDFAPNGEIFTFDSDMEWDWGLPWYRPTRIIHCVTGGEYGWRSGSSNEPDYYADTLPATVNIGLGSPTGVKFGTKSNFPEKYRKALYAFDWSYGRIVAVHLTPCGATYSGTVENLVRGKPLNLTDLEFGKDGAMYFITGGRGTQSGLYRVSFTGKKPSEPKPSKAEVAAEKAGEEARDLRHKLEAFHGKKNPKAIDFAWPHLGSTDRFIRHAARIAIESQDLASWKDRAINENNAEAALNALMALARCGNRETQKELLGALKKFPLDSLDEEHKLAKLRILTVSFARQGKPEPELAKLAIEKLDRLYPSTSERMNHELSQLLIFLEAPGVITKTMDLLTRAKTQEEQVHYIFHLRSVKNGWTVDQRKKYFDWFIANREKGDAQVTYPGGSAYNVWNNQARAQKAHPSELVQWFKDVDRDYGDGASYPKYLVNIRKEALATLSSEERTAIGQSIKEDLTVAAWKPMMERKFVKQWTMADFEGQLDSVSSRRDFKSGRAAFNDAQCILCHRFGNEGGSIGPELTAVSSKYSRRDVLESLIDPSKVVSDQYQNFTIYKKNGEDVTGRITDEDDKRVVITPSPLAPEVREEIKKSDIDKRAASKVSPMPNGLLDGLTHEEVLDLLAYLESMGKPTAKNFRR
jgi:putative heme-binding domain-containing protein